MTTTLLAEEKTAVSREAVPLERVPLLAVLGEIPFSEAGSRVAEVFGSRGYLARGHDVVTLRGWYTLSVGFDPEAVRSWQSHWAPLDPRLRAGVERFEAGQVYRGCDILPAGEFASSEFFRQWLEPTGYFHEMMAVLERDDRLLSIISLYRSRDEGQYSQGEVDRFREFLPAVRQARTLYMRLLRSENEKKALFNCWDALGVGALLVEADGRVVRENPRGAALLAKGSPLAAVGAERRLRSDRAEVTEEILRRIGEVTATGAEPRSGLLRIDRPESGSNLSLRILPFRPDGDAPYGQPAAVILFCEQVDELVPVAAETLRDAWRLTPTEARIAAELTAGRSIAQAAGRVGITVSTARTHLKRILEKSGTNRQAELVRRALALVPATRLNEA